MKFLESNNFLSFNVKNEKIDVQIELFSISPTFQIHSRALG